MEWSGQRLKQIFKVNSSRFRIQQRVVVAETSAPRHEQTMLFSCSIGYDVGDGTSLASDTTTLSVRELLEVVTRVAHSRKQVWTLRQTRVYGKPCGRDDGVQFARTEAVGTDKQRLQRRAKSGALEKHLDGVAGV